MAGEVDNSSSRRYCDFCNKFVDGDVSVCESERCSLRRCGTCLVNQKFSKLCVYCSEHEYEKYEELKSEPDTSTMCSECERPIEYSNNITLCNNTGCVEIICKVCYGTKQITTCRHCKKITEEEQSNGDDHICSHCKFVCGKETIFACSTCYYGWVCSDCSTEHPVCLSCEIDQQHGDASASLKKRLCGVCHINTVNDKSTRCGNCDLKFCRTCESIGECPNLLCKGTFFYERSDAVKAPNVELFAWDQPADFEPTFSGTCCICNCSTGTNLVKCANNILCDKVMCYSCGSKIAFNGKALCVQCRKVADDQQLHLSTGLSSKCDSCGEVQSSDLMAGCNSTNCDSRICFTCISSDITKCKKCNTHPGTPVTDNDDHTDVAGITSLFSDIKIEQDTRDSKKSWCDNCTRVVKVTDLIFCDEKHCPMSYCRDCFTNSLYVHEFGTGDEWYCDDHIDIARAFTNIARDDDTSNSHLKTEAAEEIIKDAVGAVGPTNYHMLNESMGPAQPDTNTQYIMRLIRLKDRQPVNSDIIDAEINRVEKLTTVVTYHEQSGFIEFCELNHNRGSAQSSEAASSTHRRIRFTGEDSVIPYIGSSSLPTLPSAPTDEPSEISPPVLPPVTIQKPPVHNSIDDNIISEMPSKKELESMEAEIKEEEKKRKEEEDKRKTDAFEEARKRAINSKPNIDYDTDLREAKKRKVPVMSKEDSTNKERLMNMEHNLLLAFEMFGKLMGEVGEIKDTMDTIKHRLDDLDDTTSTINEKLDAVVDSDLR